VHRQRPSKSPSANLARLNQNPRSGRQVSERGPQLRQPSYADHPATKWRLRGPGRSLGDFSFRAKEGPSPIAEDRFVRDQSVACALAGARRPPSLPEIFPLPRL
jgi:hypothetical protein